MSVDRGYDEGVPSQVKRTERLARKIFESYKITWPNVYDPQGWGGVLKKFNLSGYGLTLVGPDGIVRGIDLRKKELRKLLAEMFPATPIRTSDES